LAATDLADLTLKTGAGNDVFDLSQADPAGTAAIVIDGGTGTNELRGFQPDTTWSVTGPNAGTVGPVTFRNIQNLTGAADNQDTFVIEPGGSVSGLIDGGAGGFDSLVIAGGTYSQVVSTPTGPQSGFIDLDSQRLTYAGIEPITIATAADAAVIDLTALTSANTVTLGTGSTAGMLKVTSDNGTFDSMDFAVPASSLAVKLSNNGDTLAVNALDPTFTASLAVTGGTGDDNIKVEAVTGSGAYAVNGGAGDDQFTVGQITGTSLTIDGGTGSNTFVSAASGAVTLTDTAYSAPGVTVALSNIQSANLSATSIDSSGFTGSVVSLTGAPGENFDPQGPATTLNSGDALPGEAGVPAGGTTQAQGPSASSGGTEGLLGNTVSGAINAVAISPTNPNIVYVATVGGGVWRTLDITATTMVPIDLGAVNPLREAAPDTAANGTTAGLNGAGGLVAGTYRYKITFVNGTLGTESNASATIVSAVVPAAGGQITLNNLPLGPEGTTARNIYRTGNSNDPATAQTYTLVHTEMNNAITTWDDSSPAAGAALPMISVPAPAWTSLSDTWDSTSITALIFDPSDPNGNTLYAATGTSSSSRVGANAIGLLKTTNATDPMPTWTAVGTSGLELSGLKITALAFSSSRPLPPATALAGTAPVVTAVTTSSASVAGGQLPAGHYEYEVTFVNPATGEESLASAPIPVDLAAGQSQITLGNLPTATAGLNRVRYLYRKAPGTGSGFFLDRVIQNNDAGAAIVDAGPLVTPTLLASTLIDPSTPTTCGGVYRSENGGQSWTRVSDTDPDPASAVSGLPPGSVTDIKAVPDPANPAGPPVLIAAHSGNSANAYNGAGLYKSTDGGLTWKNVGDIADPLGGGNYNFAGALPTRIQLAVQSIRLAVPDVVAAGTSAAVTSPGGQLAAGEYRYRFTFLSNAGVESAPSADVVVTVGAGNSKVDFTNLPVENRACTFCRSSVG
jgi:hypothetical protein